MIPQQQWFKMLLVLLFVLVTSVAYRTYASPTTATGSATLPPPAPAPGDNAPNFTDDQVGGGDFRLTGTGTYVIAFWTPLSVYSQRSEPYFRRLAESPDHDARCVAVYVNGLGDGARSAPYAVVQDEDGRLSQLYNADRVPRFFVVEDGVVRSTYDGFSVKGFREFEAALEEIGSLPEGEQYMLGVVAQQGCCGVFGCTESDEEPKYPAYGGSFSDREIAPYR